MVEPKPIRVPEWNTGGSNRTEPPAGNKTSGWALNEEPPSSWFNWLQYYTGAWLFWLDERMADGAQEEDLNISALQPDASGPGGTLALAAGDGNTSGLGGFVSITAGNGAANQGGDVVLTAGTGDSNKGGDVFAYGGTGSAGAGGRCEISAGDGDGTNQRGGDIFLRSGQATGTESSGILIEACEPGVSGTGLNPLVTYMLMDGVAGQQEIDCRRRILVTDPLTTRGTIEQVPKALPTAPTIGDTYVDSSSNKLRYFNGSRYINMDPISYDVRQNNAVGRHPNPGTSAVYIFQEYPLPGGPVGPLPLYYRIPANHLSVGTQIRVYFSVAIVGGLDFSTLISPDIYVGNNLITGSPPHTPVPLPLLSGTWVNPTLATDTMIGEGRMTVVSTGPTGVILGTNHSIYEAGGNAGFAGRTTNASVTVDTQATVDVALGMGFTVNDSREITDFTIELH